MDFFLIIILVAFLAVGISTHFWTPTRPIKLFSNRMNATDQFNECLWPLPTFELPRSWKPLIDFEMIQLKFSKKD